MKKLQKTSAVYLGISLFTILFEKMYFSFSHGMSSDAMNDLFLCPLVLGSGLYGILSFVIPDITDRKFYRLFSNVYNTAVAALTSGLLLKGIFEIAGSGSALLPFYFVSAFVLFGASALILLRMLLRREEIRQK